MYIMTICLLIYTYRRFMRSDYWIRGCSLGISTLWSHIGKMGNTMVVQSTNLNVSAAST